jgi:hypothetical protein
MRYTRRLEWDMATIALNQTAVGFSHGSDTFGWRFHPRFQTPPIKGNIATFCETLIGGPTTDDDLNERQLEPGMRECTAIVVMPSFVPYATFDVRTNWFRLTDPKQTEVSMKETMVLSRSIKAMQQSAAQCAQCAHLYRDGEVHRLLRRVDQLERELPLQTMQTQIPFENTAGGFELFDTGITDLAPELIGFYGAPGINPNDRTTMYLIGDGFSVHDTNVIAGGRKVDYRLLSRQVMEVDIPRGVQILPAHPDRDDNLDEVVDVHVATPYGVSSHLLVPLAKPGAGLAGTALAWRPGAVLQTWANATKGAKGSAAFEGYFSAPDALVINYPQLLQVNDAAKILFRVQHNGVQLGGFTHAGLVVDPGTSEIRIGGAHLQDLVKSATGLNALVQPYLNYLLDEKKQSGATISLQVDAAIQVGSNAPILIGGGLQVDVILNIKDPAAPSGGSE